MAKVVDVEFIKIPIKNSKYTMTVNNIITVDGNTVKVQRTYWGCSFPAKEGELVLTVHRSGSAKHVYWHFIVLLQVAEGEDSYSDNEKKIVVKNAKILAIADVPNTWKKFIDKLRLAGVELPKSKNDYWATVKFLYILDKHPEIKEKLLQHPQPTADVEEIKEKLKYLEVQQLQELCDYIQQLIENYKATVLRLA